MKGLEKLIIVIASIISLVAIGTAVYFGKQLQENKVELKDKGDKENNSNDNINAENEDNSKNYEKAINIIDRLPAGTYKLDDLTNQQKLNIAYFYDLSESYDDGVVTKKEILNASKILFGKNTEIKLENLQCEFMDGILYEYDFNSEIFSLADDAPCLDGYGPRIDHKLISEQNIGNKYILKVYSLYSNYYHIGVAENFYSSKEDAFNEKNSLNVSNNYFNSTSTEWNTDKIFNDYKDKLNIETYTFIKEDGNLIFESLVVTKH